MYKDAPANGLFEEEFFPTGKTTETEVKPAAPALGNEDSSVSSGSYIKENYIEKDNNLVRIIWFYDDDSFKEYYPQ